jgi:aspartate carbamoyltransferase regulatory subunit
MLLKAQNKKLNRKEVNELIYNAPNLTHNRLRKYGIALRER